MKIKDWVKTPEALAVERNYKELGLIDGSWDDYEFIESAKSYEEYINTLTQSSIERALAIRYIPGPVKVHNIVYSVSGKDLPGSMVNIWMALRIAAVSTKIEGYEPGKGRLVVQERMPVIANTYDENDCFARLSPEECTPKLTTNLLWHGAIFRIGSDLERI